MRTGKVTIKGKNYITCFSSRVLVACEERAGSFDVEMDRVSSGSVKEMLWLLSELLKAGAKYAEMEGLEHEQPPTLDDILDTVGVDEFSVMFGAVTETVTNGTNRSVEVENSKNVETTRGE